MVGGRGSLHLSPALLSTHAKPNPSPRPRGQRGCGGSLWVWSLPGFSLCRMSSWLSRVLWTAYLGKGDFRKEVEAELGTVGRGETPGTVSAGDSDSVAKGSKGWASWNHGSQTLDRLEKYRPKVTAAGTLPDTSVAFPAITHFRTWGSLCPRDHLPAFHYVTTSSQAGCLQFPKAILPHVRDIAIENSSHPRSVGPSGT